MKKKIIFSSGGTGGHIFPTISLMKYFFSQNYDVTLVTDERGSKYIDKNLNFKNFFINTDTPFNKNLIKKIFAYIKIFFALIKSFYILLKIRPNLIIGMGGYVSFPICLVSAILKIPVVLYESNLILGRSNKFLLPICKKVIISTDYLEDIPKKYEHKFISVGHIIREELYNIKNFNKGSIKTNNILIIGGSQGAEIFGKIIPRVINQIKKDISDIKIFQQCLNTQIEEIKSFYKNNNIEAEVFSFKKDIYKTILNTKLAITRCGSSTLAELVHTQTPFIAIPYPFALDDHQYKNAKYYERKGYCVLIEQNNFNEKILFELMLNMIKDKNNLIEASNKMYNKKKEKVFYKIQSIIDNLIYD